MSKRKTKRRRSFPDVPKAYPAKAKPARKVGGTIDEHPQPKHRDGIEQLIIAIILAVLFRSFEAEAFIIPTGSMAPTLQGKHKDFKCPECNYRYRHGVTELGGPSALDCPSCNYRYAESTPTFNGDRILVNKFAYQFGDPKRWDVIVFKNPSNAKQNYIKRLIGLPNEELQIRHGDVMRRAKDSADDFAILRKPPGKVQAMLQPVHDTRYNASKLIEKDWPSRWFDPEEEAKQDGWIASEDRQSYKLDSPSAETRWLHYRHVLPSRSDWINIEEGRAPDLSQAQPELITDHYAYNDLVQGNWRSMIGDLDGPGQRGWHWVGDLAVEADVEISSDQGALVVQLVEGGHLFSAKFDIASGEVTLDIDDGVGSFLEKETTLKGKTKVSGSGRYRIMLANVDERLMLWVNGKFIALGSDDNAYESLDMSYPTVEDLNPARVGAQGAAVELRRLKVFRDIYHIACKGPSSFDAHDAADYTFPEELRQKLAELPRYMSGDTLAREQSRVMNSYRARARREFGKLVRAPELWPASELIARRDNVTFSMGEDQFFPMGDNAPKSQDARLWSGTKRRAGGLPFPEGYTRQHVGNFVPRSRLIGKAFLIYWPHGWPILPFEVPLLKRVPVVPNVARMGRIK